MDTIGGGVKMNIKLILFCTLIIILSSEVCLGSEFNAYINKNYDIVKEINPDEIRQDYIDCFGIDMWYPYFKAKEIENVVCQKMTLSKGNCVLAPVINKKYSGFFYRVVYTF